MAGWGRLSLGVRMGGCACRGDARNDANSGTRRTRPRQEFDLSLRAGAARTRGRSVDPVLIGGVRTPYALPRRKNFAPGAARLDLGVPQRSGGIKVIAVRLSSDPAAGCKSGRVMHSCSDPNQPTPPTGEAGAEGQAITGIIFISLTENTGFFALIQMRLAGLPPARATVGRTRLPASPGSHWARGRPEVQRAASGPAKGTAPAIETGRWHFRPNANGQPN